MNISQPIVHSYTAAMKSQLGAATTYFEGVRRIRQSQIDQINAAGGECSSYLHEMEGVDDFEALHSLHNHMINAQVERFASYWNNIIRDMTALHTELSTLLQSNGDELARTLRLQLEQLQAELSNGAGSLFQQLAEKPERVSSHDKSKAKHEAEDLHLGDHNGSSYAAAGGSGGGSGSGKRAQR